jgi:hypothetical protein
LQALNLAIGLATVPATSTNNRSSLRTLESVAVTGNGYGGVMHL